MQTGGIGPCFLVHRVLGKEQSVKAMHTPLHKTKLPEKKKSHIEELVLITLLSFSSVRIPSKRITPLK